MEYVPGLDSTVPAEDAELVAQVRRLVDAELERVDTSVPHERLPPTTGFPSAASALPPPVGAVPLAEKYTSQEALDLPLLASHSQLRLARNSVLEELLLLGDAGGGNRPEAHSFANLLQLEAADLVATRDALRETLSSKRKLLEETSARRKRRMLEYKPVDDFLQNRWNEKVNELMQLQIEKLMMDGE